MTRFGVAKETVAIPASCCEAIEQCVLAATDDHCFEPSTRVDSDFLGGIMHFPSDDHLVQGNDADTVGSKKVWVPPMHPEPPMSCSTSADAGCVFLLQVYFSLFEAVQTGR